LVKDEAQRVRACLNGGLRVGKIRDAANFDPRVHSLIYDLRYSIDAIFAVTASFVNRKSHIST
jgi:hypothetical protein